MVSPAQSPIRLSLATALLLTFGVACTSAAPDAQPPNTPAAATSTASPANEPARTTSAAVKEETANQVFTDLAQQVPEAKLVKTYTEDDDPNKLLGRPNGYTSKIAFSDSRVDPDDTAGADKDSMDRGGSIEVFPDADLAKGRAAYIQSVLKNSGLGAEYNYLRGPVLVRVTGNLAPSKAKDYQDALS